MSIALRLCVVATLAIAGCGASDQADSAPADAASASTPASVQSSAETDASAAPSTVPPVTIDENETTGTQLMMIGQSRLSPGDIAELTFSDTAVRGSEFRLERSDGGNWTLEYRLIAGSDAPPTWLLPDSDLDTILEEVVGPGPDLVIIPPAAIAGNYRICTAASVEPLCVQLSVDAQ